MTGDVVVDYVIIVLVAMGVLTVVVKVFAAKDD